MISQEAGTALSLLSGISACYPQGEDYWQSLALRIVMDLGEAGQHEALRMITVILREQWGLLGTGAARARPPAGHVVQAGELSPGRPGRYVAGSPGYLRVIKTTTVAAIQAALTVTYPETDPAGGTQKVYCSLDYPVNPQKIPSIWAEFETTDLHVAAIGGQAETDASGDLVTRWRFQGNATFTVVALASNERDLIFDELVSVIAFSAQSGAPGSFRSFIDTGGLIASTWAFDKIEMRGQGAAMGTPWMTDEVIYEQGLAIQVIGEFVSSPVTLSLVPLREVRVVAVSEADASPPAPDVLLVPSQRLGL